MRKCYRSTLAVAMIFALIGFMSTLGFAQGRVNIKDGPIPEEDQLRDPTAGQLREDHSNNENWITKWYGPDGNYENNGGFAVSAPRDLIAEGTNGKLTQPKLSTIEGLKLTQTVDLEWRGFNGGARGWTVFEIDPADRDNMNRNGPGDNIDMYAMCVIVAPKDMTAIMSPAHDDHAQIWINGEKWYNSSRWTGGAQLVGYNVEVQLRKGANVLLYRCGESGGAAYMNLHFDDETHRVADFYPNQAWDQESFFDEIGVGTDSTEVVPESTTSVTVSISPSPIQSPAPGEQLVLNLNVADGENVAGYQATVQFNTTALRYVSGANGSYLPAGAFFIPPVVDENRITLAATSLTGGSQGDGTLATLTFEVIAVKSSVLTLSEVQLTDVNADFLSVSSENGEVVGPGTPAETPENEEGVGPGTPTETVVSLTPSPVASPALGEQLTFNVSIVNGKNVAGYAFELAFDPTALRYISSGNADYLPTGAFVIPPLINESQVTLAAVSLNGRSQGEGTLATFTFEVVAVKPSTLRFSEVSLTDSNANVLPVSSENGEIVEPVRIPADVNGDGVVNLEDMDLAASRLNQRGENTADVNSDGVVDAADLLLIAAAVEQGNAAPSLHPKSIAEMFTATEVQKWLQFAHQHGLTGAKYQRGVMLLEQFLLILTPEETVVLPNYPNPFNPETWIPYHLSNAAEVHISIYAADGKLVRRLWVGHQAAGIYESRSRAAYWNGRNGLGEPVASGIYFYTLTAGDFAATRKLLIRK